MATWQYDLRIVPKKLLPHKVGEKLDMLTGAELDSLPSWGLGSLKEPLSSLLDDYLPRGKSWSESTELWGEEDKTCVKILKEKDNTVELSVRLDLRSFDKKIMSLLQEVASMFDALAIGEEGRVFSLNREELTQQLQGSRAFKFVSNPHKFFEDLEREKKKN